MNYYDGMGKRLQEESKQSKSCGEAEMASDEV